MSGVTCPVACCGCEIGAAPQRKLTACKVRRIPLHCCAQSLPLVFIRLGREDFVARGGEAVQARPLRAKDATNGTREG